MVKKELLTSIEQMNLQRIYLLESDSYRNGERIKRLKKAFPQYMIPFILGYLRNRKIRKKVDDISHYLQPEEVMYADPSQENLTGVVYTCITGGYDSPRIPIYRDPNLEYILYTDRHQEKVDVWQPREIKDVSICIGNNYTNRYYKFHPFELFKEQDYSMYIDGNVELISDSSALFAVAKNSKTGIAMHRHATMNCAYKNALWCEYNRRGNIAAIKEQVKRYRQEGFPEEFGLLEATIIIVDLHNECAKKILNAWWDEFTRSGGGRDQISFPYVLWKNGFSIDDIGNLGNDEYHNPKFRIYEHTGKVF